jgi:serine/threonine protein kinase
MSLVPGARRGPYEILNPIGTGGMGEVYKARDTRLDRTVAIKISKEAFSQRFEGEARAVAALNHPNICQLYDVGPDYLVMEFVEGAPIASVDSTRKLLDIAVQIADGLAAAHAALIIHRDLKPDNILITRDGRVKILDFGLAKMVTAGKPDDNATGAMTRTEGGATVGTIAYMSPEQARGSSNLSAQSDQFSFGLVLYELATGRRVFPRGSAAETMTAIIREEADPLPANVPAPLRWIVERLLAKDPSERYESTRDLYREVRQIRDRLSESTASGVQAASTAEIPNRPRS